MIRPGLVALFLLSAAPAAFADTITLKTGKELKGLVVERHADRILFSTVKGEIPILLSGIKKIDYDDPAQNALGAGKEYEEKNRLGEALSYYERAVELNPALDEARRRAQSVRNRFWTQSTAKPLDEIAKRQALYDLWEAGGPSAGAGDEAAKKGKARQAGVLKEGLGLELERKGDWVLVSSVAPKSDAAVAGLKRKDRLVAVDGNSLRYLRAEAAARQLIEPPHTACQLDYERDISLTGEADPGKLGLRLNLAERGLEVASVAEESAAADAGFTEQDLVTAVNGAATRYLALGKVKKLMKESPAGRPLVLTVRRSAILTRK